MWRRISSSALALWIVKVWHLFREEELVETSTKVRLIKSIISRFSIRRNFLSKKLGYALQLPIMEGSFELHQLLTSTTSPFPQVCNYSILMRGQTKQQRKCYFQIALPQPTVLPKFYLSTIMNMDSCPDPKLPTNSSLLIKGKTSTTICQVRPN